MVPALQTYRGGSVRRSPALRVGLLSSRIVGFAVLAIFALLYIAQASAAATATVQVQDLRGQAAQISNDVEQLQLESTRAQTLDMISTQATPLGLVPVESAEYLSSTTTQ